MVAEKTVALFKRLCKQWAPQAELTTSEWADRYRVLTTKTSAEPGPWRTDRAPYQREIMDSINDPDVQEVAIMASAQVGKTEFLLNMVGYHIDYDPCPILFMLPNDKLVEYFSKNRLSDMIDASPGLREKVAEVKSRDSSNTISEKSFPGGYIALVGANSPASLSSRPIRIVLADEVDRYPVSAGKEGDPITLATQRTKTFYNRKHIYVSTPTLKEVSRIEQLYNDSTAEEWHMPCPSCNELQTIKWGERLKFEYKQSDDGEFIIESVHYACKECGAMHTEKEWKRGEGRWVAKKKHSFRRGFHLNQFVSPWSNWSDIVRQFLVANRDGTETLKAWTNTVLGETWEEIGEKLKEEELFERCEDYEAEVPHEVKVLTAAVDVQDDRFEIEVIGWGVGKESWGIEYHVIHGNLRQPQVWMELDEYLSRRWAKKDGRSLSIAITCIDSGGHFTTEVYRFCAPRVHRRIFAIKGQGSRNGEYVPLIARHTKTKREGSILFHLGVDEGKAKVFADLKVGYPGPGYCHFPKGRGYSYDYFRGLTAEKKQLRKRMGVAYYEWVKIRERNEPFDLRVYNVAALEILNPRLENIIDMPPIPDQPAQKKRPKKYVKRSKIW